MPLTNNVNETAYRESSISEEILGIFLKDPGLFVDYKNRLTETMFGPDAWIYQSIFKNSELGTFNFKTIALENKDKLNYLLELRNSVPSTSRLPGLVIKLKKQHLATELYTIGQRMTDISENCDPDELLSEAQSIINNLSNTEATELHDTDKDLDDYFEYMEEIIADPSKAFGLMTGIEELDRITTGFHKGDFIVVGARTSMGKSAFMLEIALTLTKAGHRVAIYSLEMSKRQIYNRMMANLMNLELNIIKSGKMFVNRIPEMKKHKEFLRRIYIDDTRGVSADYITDSMRRLKRTRGIDAVMVDYIQDVKEIGESNDNGGSALSRICRKLRKGAQEMDVVMVGLSQVNRGVEERKDKRPMASDLTGSAGIESSADSIALLYREDYYDAETDKKDLLEVNFCKQRNAEVGKIELKYDKRYQQVRSLTVWSMP